MTEALKLNLEQRKVEWRVYEENTFNIIVVAWPSKKYMPDYEGQLEWHWHVYAIFDEEHVLFDKLEACKSLHWHGGCTYDQYVTYEGDAESEHRWMRPRRHLKVGSDYSHYMDHYDEFDPKNGIPFTIENDALELLKDIKERMAYAEESTA